MRFIATLLQTETQAVSLPSRGVVTNNTSPASDKVIETELIDLEQILTQHFNTPFPPFRGQLLRRSCDSYAAVAGLATGKLVVDFDVREPGRVAGRRSVMRMDGEQRPPRGLQGVMPASRVYAAMRFTS